MNPRQLSHELRNEISPDLKRRRWIFGLSMVGIAAGKRVSLYQMGMIACLAVAGGKDRSEDFARLTDRLGCENVTRYGRHREVGSRGVARGGQAAQLLSNGDGNLFCIGRTSAAGSTVGNPTNYAD